MKSILTLLLVLFSSNLFALEYNAKYTLDTYTFLQQASLPELAPICKHQYFLQTKDAVDYTKVFVRINEKYSKEALAAYSCKEILRTQTVALLSLPVSSIPGLAGLSGIEQIEVATQAVPLVDTSLYYTRTDLVHEGTGLDRSYTGAGVILGSVDYGFDFTHPMFSDKEGNSRVTRAWVPLDESGTPPAFSDEGTLYTNSDYIKNTLKYTSTGNWHASHVLGIAAGSKVKALHTQKYYEGVATASEIAVVECDGITINEALQYLIMYADSVGKPLVVNMSLGSIGGPCDGKDLRDINISEMLNKKPEGRILVASAGNSGGTLLHIGHKFEDENKSINVYQRFMPAEGNPDYNLAYFDVWGQPGDMFSVEMEMCKNFDDAMQYWEKVETVSTTDDIYMAGIMEFEADNIYADIQVEFYAFQQYQGNGRPFVRVMFQDHSYANSQLEMYPWVVRYKITSLNGTQSDIHCWNVLRYNKLWSDNQEITADTYYSLGSPGTIPEVVTVGAYVSRDTLRTLEHGNWPIVTGKLNEIASFSSKGPLLDNTIKPDITAPGTLVYSAYNNYDVSNAGVLGSIVDYVEDASTENKHIIFPAQGTSMSCPVVSGIVALMLEINPNLTSSEIKDILRVTAINDAWTGNAKEEKSVIWGWGKINAYDIMKELEATDIYEDAPGFELKVYPNPVTTNWLYVEANNTTNLPFVINIYDNAGKLVYLSSMQNTKQIDLSSLPAGNYFIEVSNHKSKALQKFIK